jgi:hypothetical protein
MLIEIFHASKWAVLYASFLCIVLLYPYRFRKPTNHLAWTSEANGVIFPSVGVIRSKHTPEALHNALISGQGLSVEVWLSAANIHQIGPARIVSYSLNPSFRNFSLAQQGASLVMRLRTTKTNMNGTNPELTVENVFRAQVLEHIVVTYDFMKQRVYLNGQLRLEAPIPGGNFANWDPHYPLLLGNERTGDRPWEGSLFLAAIYNRALLSEDVYQNYRTGKTFLATDGAPTKRVGDALVVLYLFNENSGKVIWDQSGSPAKLDLVIPKDMVKRFLDREFALNGSAAKDAAFNLAAFILLGFLIRQAIQKSHRSRLKASLAVIVGGLLFSVTIESLQYFIEDRSSSMLDVLSNTAGVLLGLGLKRS